MEPLVGKFIHLLLNVRNGNELQDFINLREAELTREELKALKEFAPYFENKHGWDNPINEYVYRTYLMPAIPKFLYYDEYRMLPSRVSVNELAEGKELTDSQRMAKALFFLAGIDVKKQTQDSGFERYKSELLDDKAGQEKKKSTKTETAFPSPYAAESGYQYGADAFEMSVNNNAICHYQYPSCLCTKFGME